MATEFFNTIMGRVFFEGTMPALVRELKRLNDNLEKLAARSSPAEPTDDVCDECHNIIDKNGGNLVSTDHAKSCSLYPQEKL